jgi:hypothetical protein
MLKITITVPSSLNVHAVLYYFAEALAKQNYLSPQEENDVETDVMSDISVVNNSIVFVCSEKYKDLIATTRSSLDHSISFTTMEVKSYYYPDRKDNNTDKINLYLTSGNITAKSDNSNEGKALPATCNVDIILALPVNGASCSVSNGDYTTNPIGSPYTLNSESSTSSTISAPICEISRGYRKFLKDNFFHTRGANVGIIPYSSKISIPTAKKTDWTKAAAAFSTSNIDSNKCICGKDLYGTSGVKDAALVQASYSWGTDGVYPIMHRSVGNSTTSLLSTTNPNSDVNRFVKMNLNPCYMGYANTLGMKCEKDCTKFQPNPYPIVELTADVRAAYEIFGSYFPFYDVKNASNFIFLPMEWANNLLKGNWNNDPAASGDSNTVQRESKTTGGRKRAVIIVVNKPDWFEPGELTYLGFDNDAAALPMHESDKINFAIDYSSNTSRKFLDGTSYNGTMTGSKKILTFSCSNLTRSGGYYETSGRDSMTGTLSFPEKGTVILKVARATGSPSGWQKINHNLSTWGHDNYSGIAHGGGCYISIGVDGGVAKSSSDNMTNWALNVANLNSIASSSSSWRNVVYGNNKFLAINDSGYTAYSTNGTTWQNGGKIVDSVTKSGISSTTAMCYGHNIFLVLGGTSIAHSSDGLLWTVKTGAIPINATWRGVTAVSSSGKFVAISSSGKVITVTNPTSANWTENTSGSSSLSSITSNSWGGVCCGSGKLMAVSYSAIAAYCSSESGSSWENQSTGLSSIHYGEWYGTFFENSTFYAHTSNVYLAKNELTTNSGVSSIKFANLKSSSDYNGADIKIDEEATFTIRDSDISDTKEGNKYCIKFDMKMIRLISAEISNQVTEYYKPPAVESLSFENCDTINFKAGETSAEVLSYTTTSGVTNYKNGAGLQCGDHTKFSGTFTTSKAGSLYVKVEKNDSKSITTSVSSGIDLTKWHTASPLPSSINNGSWQTRNIAYSGDKFYAVNHSGHIVCSSDGKAWTSGATLEYSSSKHGSWRGMSYGNGKLLAVSFNGYVAYSSDGTTWSTSNGPSSNRNSYWYGGTAYGTSKFIMTNGDAYIAYSSDGSIWEFLSSAPLKQMNVWGWDGAATCGKYNNVDKFLAICYYGQVATSPNGTTWSSLGNFSSSDSYFGLCYGDNKFVAINGGGSVYYSTDGGTTWTLVGSPLVSISNSTWSAIGYGNNMFVAIASNGYAAYCNDVLTSSTTIAPTFKFNGSTISGNTTVNVGTQNAEAKTIDMENIRLVSASLKYSDIAKGVHNVVTLSDSISNTKNGCTLNFSGTTSVTNGFRTVSETNSIGSLEVANTTFGVKSLSITVAPLDGGAVSDGKFQLKSETDGKTISDISVKQVGSKETFYVNPADLTVTQTTAQKAENKVTYKISFSMTKIKLISAQVTLDNRAVSKYPDFSWRLNSRLVDWSKSSAAKDNDINITNKYSNYNSEDKLHSINSSSCRPTVSPKTYVGDCTFISQEYSTTPFILNLTAPNRSISGYYAPGIVRIFSESSRNSPNKLDVNTSTSNSAYLIATEFTYPVNHLLASATAAYQTSTTANNKTLNRDATAALKELTKSAATELKNSDIRVYIIKYKCPTKYTTHQLDTASSTTQDYDYSYLNSCASSSSYIYTVNNEAELEVTLSEIAADIKSSGFANYQEAKIVN